MVQLQSTFWLHLKEKLVLVGKERALEQAEWIAITLEDVDQCVIVQATVLDGIWADLPAGEPFDVYPIDEIAAEKLRCIIQRVQCRDLYDLFRLGDDLGVSYTEVRPLFERKTQAKGIDPATFSTRFEDRVDRYRKRWDTEMTEHVADPPLSDDVVRSVRRNLRSAGLLAS